MVDWLKLGKRDCVILLMVHMVCLLFLGTMFHKESCKRKLEASFVVFVLQTDATFM